MKFDELGAVLTRHGTRLTNRLVLSPLTNQLSPGDGSVSRKEIDWLRSRARDGYGVVFTAAAAVHPDAHAFRGQLGFHDPRHIVGLTHLSAAARSGGGIAMAQLLHGGPRALREAIGPVSSDSIRQATAADLYQAVADFGAAAALAERAGFGGAQLHAAYRFLHSAYLAVDPGLGRDLLRRTLDAMRAATSPGFLLSVRFNLDGYEQDSAFIVALSQELIADQMIDHLDLVAEAPLPEALHGLRKQGALLQVTGGINSTADVTARFEAGADLVGVGVAAVLHHDFMAQLCSSPSFHVASLPVAAQYLRRQGADGDFLAYLRRWPGFVAAEQEAA